METCRNTFTVNPVLVRAYARIRYCLASVIMANVTLKNIKKIYPFSGDDVKRNKRKAKAKKKVEVEVPEEEKVKLQVTEQGVVAVQEFNLEIQDKEFIVLVGPSGCGKSTTLRMIAGLEEISGGELYIGDRLVNDVAPKDRDIAMVFQNYALYPHMTVYDNIAFALKLRHTPKDEIDRRVKEAAEILDITQYLGRKPKAMSGGQRQRVAIGRAIVREPQVLLMDEPLSNLDAKLRNQMRAEIIKLREKIQTTFIYVTHDQTEAMTLGDRIVIMKDGFIQQVGTPTEVFDMPVNLFVAEFIGAPKMNTFDTDLIYENGKYFVTPYGAKIEVTGKKAEMLRERGIGSRKITLGVRPEHITMAGKNDSDAITCTLKVNEMMGSELHLHVTTDNGDKLIVRIPTVTLEDDERTAMVYGSKLHITFEGKVMHFFDAETGTNLLA